MLLTPDWQAPPGIVAVCTTRLGGASRAPWASLNLGDHVGDDPAAVADNRHRVQVAAALPCVPRWLRQVHGVAVADLDALPAGQIPEADAAITSRPGEVCAVLTADCLPVVLAAADGSQVAAAHAGWRGLAGGVLEATVAAMRARARVQTALCAWLGPAIGPAHFEVGDEVRGVFLAADSGAVAGFSAGRAGKWQCDLYQLARRRLVALGVAEVSGGGFCTYAEEDRFFSHRRDVQHRGLAATGRMATLVWRQK